MSNSHGEMSTEPRASQDNGQDERDRRDGIVVGRRKMVRLSSDDDWQGYDENYIEPGS